MIDWESSFAQGLGFYCNFDTIGPPTTNIHRQFCQDKVTGVTSTAATTTSESSGLFDLGVAFLGATSENDGFVFGSAATFGTVPDIASYCRSDSPFTVCCKIRPNNSFGARLNTLAFCQDPGAGVDIWNIQIKALETLSFETGGGSTATTVGSYNDGNFFTLYCIHLPSSLAGGTNAVYVFNGFGLLLETVSVAVTTSPGIGDVTPISIGRLTAGIGLSPMAASLEWCAIWKRSLEQVEMAALASDPYQFLLPAGNNRRIGGKVVVSATNPRFRALTGVGK